MDDDPILNKFTTGNPLTVAAMRILDEFLNDKIKETRAYKDYDADYLSVVVPMIQPQPVVSTQGTPRTLSAPRSPKLKRTLQKKKKKKKVVGESNELKKPLRIKITNIRVPISSEIEYDQLTRAQQVSIAMDVSAKETEEKENVAIVKKDVLADKVEQMVERDEEPETHKEIPVEYRDGDENDNDQHNFDALIRMKKMGSLEIRDKEKQKPIPTPIDPLGLTYLRIRNR
ncbi:hypothetical protein Tco_0455182 [Tanacetum coccineum]